MAYALLNMYSIFISKSLNSIEEKCKRFGTFKDYQQLLQDTNLKKECTLKYSLGCDFYIDYLYFYNKNCKDFNAREEKIIKRLSESM